MTWSACFLSNETETTFSVFLPALTCFPTSVLRVAVSAHVRWKHFNIKNILAPENRGTDAALLYLHLSVKKKKGGGGSTWRIAALSGRRSAASPQLAPLRRPQSDKKQQKQKNKNHHMSKRTHSRCWFVSASRNMSVFCLSFPSQQAFGELSTPARARASECGKFGF